MPGIVIYVTCHNDASEAIAKRLAIKYPCLRPLRLPKESQSHLFEGVMFTAQLPRLLYEWASADYVGIVSYQVERKAGSIARQIRLVESGLYDFVPLFVKDHMTYAMHSPAVRKVLEDTARVAGLLQSVEGPTCYANCWVTRTTFMRLYLDWFNGTWLPALERHPLVWSDASYGGSLRRETLLQLSRGRSQKYSCHPFVNERIVYAFFRSIGAKVPGYLLEATCGKVLGILPASAKDTVLKFSGRPLTVGRDTCAGTLRIRYIDERGHLQVQIIENGVTAEMPNVQDYR